MEGILADYERIGYRVLRLSTKTGQGMEELRKILEDGIWNHHDSSLYTPPQGSLAAGGEGGEGDAAAADEGLDVRAEAEDEEGEASSDEGKMMEMTMADDNQSPTGGEEWLEDPFARNELSLQDVRPRQNRNQKQKQKEKSSNSSSSSSDTNSTSPPPELDSTARKNGRRRRLRKKDHLELLDSGALESALDLKQDLITVTQAAFAAKSNGAKRKPLTSVFVGQSGTGKSSTLNSLMPGLGLFVKQLQTRTSRGRHATTSTHLYKILSTPPPPPPVVGGDEDGAMNATTAAEKEKEKNNDDNDDDDDGVDDRGNEVTAEVIDSPGFQNYNPVLDTETLTPDLLSRGFPELELHAKKCPLGPRCTHLSEPDCAVRNQVQGLSIQVFQGGLWGDLRRMTPENAAETLEKYEWVEQITQGLHAFDSDQFEMDVREQQDLELERGRRESRFKIITDGSISLRRYQSYCELFSAYQKAVGNQFSFAEMLRNSGRKRGGKGRKRRPIRL